MGQKMTWDEMKKAYPDEWLLITDFKIDKYGGVADGVVERHSKNDKEVFALPSLGKNCAFRYTGECQFPGGWRSHAKHDHI
ncbi:MAG: hypothetical protein ABIE74_12800 [Pseudomonadota bacterium]